MTVHQLNVPLRVSSEELQELIRPLIEPEVKRIRDDEARVTGALGTELEKQRGELLKQSNDMTDQVAQRLRQVDLDADALKDKVNKNANRILIPTAIAVLLLVILGAWGVMGGAMFAARKESLEVIQTSQVVEGQLKAKQQDLDALSAGIGKLNGDLQLARKNSGAANEESRIAQLEATQKRIETRLDALLTQLAAAKATTSAVAPPQAPGISGAPSK